MGKIVAILTDGEELFETAFFTVKEFKEQVQSLKDNNSTLFWEDVTKDTDEDYEKSMRKIEPTSVGSRRS